MAAGSPAVAAPPSFVGRTAELEALGRLVLHRDEPGVLFVHAIAGMGKSALLRAFLERARAEGADVIAVDCRTAEPTERGFMQAVGRHDDVAGLLDDLGARSAPVVLALDHYEVFRLMDTWLRQVFAPALPLGTQLVLAGREPPVSAWYTVAVAGGFETLPLDPLGDADAAELLAQRGVQPAEVEALVRLARGHPLALMLASAAAAEQPGLRLEEAATGRVVAELARLYLADVQDPEGRRALEAASVVRRTTEPLLGAMLGEDAAAEALARLLDLPFVDARRDGLIVHESVREAVASFLEATSPTRYRGYRRAAWSELRDEVREAAAGELWRYTADMLYLIGNPVVREAFFPSGSQPLAVEPARRDDEAAIRRITTRHEGPAEAALLEAWWREAPQTFSVVRDRDGLVTAFFILLDNATMRPPAVDDPVVRLWLEHVREEAVPRAQRVLGLRRWLDADHGEAPCASQAACWLDVKRTYMALRPDLRRIYVTVQDVSTYWPVVEKLGFRPVGETPLDLDRAPYASVVLDFGPGSVDGWLAGLVAAELGLEPRVQLDEEAREVVLDGRRISLTQLEFGVLARLRAGAGRPVSRRDLLETVWGTTYAGGSNVVDAVVHSLRQKLGTDGEAVETARGVGYRLRSGWAD
jgi:hypothetical protein